jgi:hypothetical protein
MKQVIAVFVALLWAGALSVAAVPGGCPSPLADREDGGRGFVIEKNGEVWSVWQGGELRWRAENVSLKASDFFSEQECSLVLIASWECPGNIFTGGALQAWDLNGNGTPDLSYSNWAEDAYVYEAVGDNEFEQVHQYPCPVGSYYTRLLCAGDGDSDDLAEMVFGTGTSGVPRDLFFVESPESGAYPDSVVLVLPEQNIGVNHMRTADLDGDGRREYIGTTQGTHDMLLAIWESRGDNSYTQVFATHFSAPPWSVSGEIAVGDFDADGQGDLAVPDNGDSSVIHVLECTGDDLYEEVWAAEVPTQNVYWVTPGPDLDRDGRGDFVVTGGEGWSTVVWSFLMYESNGDNDYELVWSYQITGPMIDGGSTTGDVDGDGWPELLCQTADRTLLFRAAGDNELELCWEHSGSVVGQGEHRIIAPDLDGDSRGEVVWWTEDNPGVLVVYEQPEIASVSMECEALTPIFCRGKDFYFKITVTNSTGGDVSGALGFNGYLLHDCDPWNLLITIPRSKTYPAGVTAEYYFFRVPSAAAPGPYSVSIDGNLSGYELFCCMNADIVACQPWRVLDKGEWELVEADRPEVALPTVTEIYQNYPNPFNASTTINYQLPIDSDVKLELYNLRGQKVATLADETQQAGYRAAVWDASEVSSGVYFYKLTAGDFTETKRMMLVK